MHQKLSNIWQIPNMHLFFFRFIGCYVIGKFGIIL